MLLYGAGGHAKVVLSCLENNNVGVRGFFDDNPKSPNIENVVFLGKYTYKQFPKEDIIISIGDNVIRKIISKKVKHNFGYVSHQSSIVDKIVEIGRGTVIFQNAVVQRGCLIGRHVIINTSSSIDHDCKVMDFAHIAPNTTLCGEVTIGSGSLIGAGSTIRPGVEIGKWCTIGVGTVVVNNIPDFSTVIGNPGRVI